MTQGRGLHSDAPETLLERAAFGLGWAVDRALAKPRAIRNRLHIEWVIVRNAYRRGFHRLKPGQFGYGRGPLSASYAHERATASDRQVS